MPINLNSAVQFYLFTMVLVKYQYLKTRPTLNIKLISDTLDIS